MASIYDELDDEELYVLDEERYNQKMEEQKKERVERLKQEAEPFLLDNKKSSWAIEMLWENRVQPSKKLIHLLGALRMIELYNEGVTPEDIQSRYISMGIEEYLTMIAYLPIYFKQGQELSDQLKRIKAPVRGK